MTYGARFLLILWVSFGVYPAWADFIPAPGAAPAAPVSQTPNWGTAWDKPADYSLPQAPGIAANPPAPAMNDQSQGLAASTSSTPPPIIVQCQCPNSSPLTSSEEGGQAAGTGSLGNSAPAEEPAAYYGGAIDIPRDDVTGGYGRGNTAVTNGAAAPVTTSQ